MSHRRSLPVACSLAFWGAAACASELVYVPVNPNFGGAPTNGPGLTSLLQTGLDNEAFVWQSGERNVASILQAGAGNRAGIDQQGTLNTARIEQYGQQGYARITQYGNGKSATLIQH